VIKFDATWWWIVEDESLLDDRVRLWLMRFRRSLRQLARDHQDSRRSSRDGHRS
jgi:hypothetical protein